MDHPVSVDDVAAYILKHHGPMSAMKLQKLVYYCQAWHLAWDGIPMFREQIQAWSNGPVVPRLWNQHRGNFTLGHSWPSGSVSALSSSQRETIEAVVKYYGHKQAQWLSDLTHSERPWVEARKGLAPGERGHAVIQHAELADYYGGLAARKS